MAKRWVLGVLVGGGIAAWLYVPPLSAARQGATESAPLGLSVTHRARSIQPGEVVVVTATFSAPVASVKARALDRPLGLFPSVDHATWTGLVGIDLDVAPGDHVVSIAGTTADGRVGRSRHTLRVQPKEFPTRRLTVAPQYVNPPADVVDRIQREAARTQEIFSTQTSQRRWSGRFGRPVPGAATSSFGRRSVFNGQARSPHSGADFRANEGTPVAAPNAGRVVLSQDLYFSGNAVVIDHGLGLYSFFAHLSRMAVEVGEDVERGDIIGHVGATGRVTGAHLHWTVRLNEARVDPLALMEIVDAP